MQNRAQWTILISKSGLVTCDLLLAMQTQRRRRRASSEELLYVAGIFWSLGFLLGRFSRTVTTTTMTPRQDAVLQPSKTRFLQESSSISSFRHRPRSSQQQVSSIEYWPNPIIVVGLPKSGTNSIASYFRCGGIERVSHHRCLNRACGSIIRKNVLEGRKPLSNTGRANVYAQMDVEFDPTRGLPCYFPQIEALEQIHAAHPQSTFILNTRNTTRWVESLRAWSGMDRRLASCNITGLPEGVGLSDSELMDFYESHTKRIREFVEQHPSHRLVEVVIDSPDAGQVLQDAFGISESCWGHENGNAHPPLTEAF
jgi:hypothetical protein